jgi:hypothetical protein
VTRRPPGFCSSVMRIVRLRRRQRRCPPHRPPVPGRGARHPPTAAPRQALTASPASAHHRTGEGIEGADLARQDRRRLVPVEPGLGLVDLFGIGDAVAGLCHGDKLIEARQCFDHQFSAQRRKAVVQAAGAVLRVDGDGAGQQHGTGIETGFHAHDGDAGLRVSSLDGAMDRRRAAPARQQRGVDVDAAAARQVEHGLRQDEAVSGHHHELGAACGAGGADRLMCCRILQALGLGHRDTVRQRHLLHGGGLQRHAAAGGTVGLGQHQYHLVTGGKNRFECARRKLWRTGKNQLHGWAFRKSRAPA